MDSRTSHTALKEDVSELKMHQIILRDSIEKIGVVAFFLRNNVSPQTMIDGDLKDITDEIDTLVPMTHRMRTLLQQVEQNLDRLERTEMPPPPPPRPQPQAEDSILRGQKRKKETVYETVLTVSRRNNTSFRESTIETEFVVE